jgi:hypothetical protein
MAVVATVFAAAGSAGSRAVNVTFDVFPAPAEVSYGHQIAYRATFENTGGALAKVLFRQTFPAASGVEATPVSSTCPSTPVITTTPHGREWTCDFGRMAPHAAPLSLTVVWQAPTLVPNVNCPGCLVTNGRWLAKQGTSSAFVTFPPGGKNVAATLLASGAGGDPLRAAGYVTGPASCADPNGPGNLQTNPSISLANPVSTTVCFPAFTLPAGSLDLGFKTVLTETAGSARTAEVCIAALGTGCAPGYVDANFAPQVVTHVFHVSDAALADPHGITAVRHNGVLVTAATCAANGLCVLSISLDHSGIWTIVATSPTNGSWDW